MNEILKQIGSYGLVPVVKIAELDKAVPLAKALCDGGLPVAEITFRTACAKDAIAAISAAFPDMLVGAGTVLTVEQADQAIEAGAKFIVSPGLNLEVVKHCLGRGIPITPGCATPSEVDAAVAAGLDVVKFFPAEAAGGLEMINMMSGPYPNVKFIPTGGIGMDNLLEYLKNDKILAVGGSFMAKNDYIAAGEFDKITAGVKEALGIMYGFELKHLGVNCENEGKAKAAAALVESMFGFLPRETKGAVFGGDFFEFMKAPYLGTLGHVAIGTNFLGRAMEYFGRRGITFNTAELKVGADGKLRAAYFSEELFGFAFHLLQK